MKILFITNLYPPYYLGGYELRCQQVNKYLRRQGHQTVILTSNYKSISKNNINDIYRVLKLFDYPPNSTYSTSKLNMLLSEIYNIFILNKFIDYINPDIIYIWNLAGFSPSIISNLQNSDFPLVFSIDDKWLTNMNKHHDWIKLWNHLPSNKLKAFFKNFIQNNILRKIVEHFIPTHKIHYLKNSIFNSKFTQRYYLKSNIQIEDSEIISCGINTNNFNFINEKPINKYDKISLLLCGRITYGKGVHIALNALKILQSSSNRNFELNIAGKIEKDNYRKYLTKLQIKNKIEQNVNFYGQKPRKDLIEIYQNSTVYLFPILWKEPFGMTVIEAMSCGTPVIGSPQGGSKEYMENGYNCLTFSQGQANILAEKILKLINSPQLYHELRKNGRNTVEKYFSLDKMNQKIEDKLISVAKNK